MQPIQNPESKIQNPNCLLPFSMAATRPAIGGLKGDRLGAVALLALAAALRIPVLESIPPPLNVDEASRGYDAWCLLETGADRHGERWPLFLKSFGPGDYTGAISAWLMMPSIALLGPTPTAIRLPNAVLGVLTVALLWLWMRRAFDRRVAFVAALLLAVCPWHLRLSRMGHEAGLVPFFVTAAGWCLSRARLLPTSASAADRAGATAPSASAAKDSPIRCMAFAALGGVCLGAAAWTYPAARFLVPVMIVGFLAVARRWVVRQFQTVSIRYAAVASLAGFVIGAMPVWWTWLRHPEQIAARAQATLVLTQGNLSTRQKAAALGLNYLREFAPDVLFLRSDDLVARDLPGGRLPDYGRLLHIEAAFGLVGVGMLLANARRSPLHRILLMWLLIYPLPAAICIGWNPHPLRAVLAMPAWSIVSAVGLAWLWSWCQRAVAPRGAALVCGALAAGVIVDAAWCSWAYFARYPAQAADHFQENMARAVVWAREHSGEYDFAVVSPWVNQGYIYVLLYWPIAPRDLARMRANGQVQSTPWLESFDHVVRMDRFVFARFFRPGDPLAAQAREAVQRALANWPDGARGLVIDVPGFGQPGVVIARVPRRQGGVGLEIRQWRLKR